MGEGRYQPLLCLSRSRSTTATATRRRHRHRPATTEEDLGPLAEVIADPEIELVLHAARQDVALLRRDFGVVPRNVFDTQVAAGFAGMRAQLGYEPLIKEMLGVRLRKSRVVHPLGRPPADRPSSSSYAREDVLHLLQLAAALQGRLRELGPPGVGARGVPLVRGRSTTRRDLDHALRPAAARQLAGARPARRRARARRVARGGRARRPTARSTHPARRRADRDRQAPPRRTSTGCARSAASTRRRCTAAAGRSSRPSSAVASASRSRSRATQPSQPDAEDAPLIALGEALVRTRAMESRARLRADRRARRTCRRSSPRCATARPSPTCARCRAGGARSSAPSCSSCWPAGARCASARPPARDRRDARDA